jgi:dihydroorotate dehydrogenase electron transfer subunit
MAPLLFAAKIMSGHTRELKSFMGFGDERSVFGAREMGELADATFCVGGFVTDKVAEALGSERPNMIFSCGPKPMLWAIKKICAARGTPLYASLEERMGCGMGACLVCACQAASAGETPEYRRVCRDGPVFDAREVALE